MAEEETSAGWSAAAAAAAVPSGNRMVAVRYATALGNPSSRRQRTATAEDVPDAMGTRRVGPAAAATPIPISLFAFEMM